mmetsp:Transcript_35067/g.73039  ORF Transcript_35067/g.73039 Transcript_35067/m.73039 type:complete len:102 (+) Transcript_35067:403-708(+)
MGDLVPIQSHCPRAGKSTFDQNLDQIYCHLAWDNPDMDKTVVELVGSIRFEKRWKWPTQIQNCVQRTMAMNHLLALILIQILLDWKLPLWNNTDEPDIYRW